jgi:hypothetical protein
MERKSRLKLLEATEDANTVTEETEEDSEEEETGTMASETTEDPEEISVTDQRAASIAERTDISPETVRNVIFKNNFSKKTKRIQQRQKRQER